MGAVNVELLVVVDCPNEEPAAALLRTALDDVGLSDVGFITTVIGTQQAGDERSFIGSPTVLINGADPFVEPNRTPGLACRVYNTPEGLAGIPNLRDVRRALKLAAAS
jgi:hypothetical protein